MRATAWLYALVFAGLLSGCESTREDRVVVFAAASLTDAFADAERAFESAHPGVEVVVNTAGSQALRLQIESGARADVFASANPAHLLELVDTGDIKEHRVLTTNRLVAITPESNPAGLVDYGDLADAPRVVVGTDEVPIGRYTKAFLDRVGGDFAQKVESHVVSREANVRLVLAKVELGEADAAVVYRTDAMGRRVRSLPIPDELTPVAQYRIGMVRETPMARAWYDFVSPGGEGYRFLQARGFGDEP